MQERFDCAVVLVFKQRNAMAVITSHDNWPALQPSNKAEAKAVQYSPAALVLDDLDTAKDIRPALISGGQLQPPPSVLLSQPAWIYRRGSKLFTKPQTSNSKVEMQ